MIDIDDLARNCLSAADSVSDKVLSLLKRSRYHFVAAALFL